MEKISFLFVFMFLTSAVFAAEISLSLEKILRQKGTVTTTEEISKEYVENKRANQAMDILENTTGVFVQKTGDMGRADPVIRGFGTSP